MSKLLKDGLDLLRFCDLLVDFLKCFDKKRIRLNNNIDPTQANHGHEKNHL